MSASPRTSLSSVSKRAQNTLDGFKSFILRGNVVDLAVGIVIGAAFTAVVTAMVSDIITPLIPTPKGALSNATWTIPLTHGVIKYGDFINAVISFLIIAAVLYFFIVRPVSTLMDRYKPQKTDISTRDCPYCLQSVPLLATRCSYCTSVLPTDGHQTDGAALVHQDSLKALEDKLAEAIVTRLRQN